MGKCGVTQWDMGSPCDSISKIHVHTRPWYRSSALRDLYRYNNQDRTRVWPCMCGWCVPPDDGGNIRLLQCRVPSASDGNILQGAACRTRAEHWGERPAVAQPPIVITCNLLCACVCGRCVARSTVTGRDDVRIWLHPQLASCKIMVMKHR